MLHSKDSRTGSTRLSDTIVFGALIIGDEILSGKRQDKHMKQVIAALAARGLELAWVEFIGDDPSRIVATLTRTLASSDIVFCFGGIGATPDDHTRRCAALAAGVELHRHPEALAEIEARFGAAAFPHRVLMADLPQGSTLIPNSHSRVPGFSLANHHFMPGFPEMALPMLDWVLDTRYLELSRPGEFTDQAIIVEDAYESQLLELMNDCVSRFPELKLFSLPQLAERGRRIELGFRGTREQVPAAIDYLGKQVTELGYPWRQRE